MVFKKGNKLGFKKRYIPWNKGKSMKHSGSFKKGHIPWTSGKGHSQKTKQKLRVANLGKKHSYETRKKISMTNSGEKEFTEFKRLLNKRIRIMSKYLKWRADVFKRDNYHCQNCGEKGYLEAHHIIPLSIIMSKFKIKTINQANKCNNLWNVGNGISYCQKCHIKLDKSRGISIENYRRISST